MKCKTINTSEIQMTPMIFTEENTAIITEEQGTTDIVNAMREHDSNAALLEAACAALWTLSVEGLRSFLSW